MGKQYEELTPELNRFIALQKLFLCQRRHF